MCWDLGSTEYPIVAKVLVLLRKQETLKQNSVFQAACISGERTLWLGVEWKSRCGSWGPVRKLAIPQCTRWSEVA